LPLVSTTPVANLPPVSATPVANFSTIFASVVDTGGKFATGVNDAGGKLPPVSTTPAANLPPVSLTPVLNNGNNISRRHLKVNLKAKIYIYVNSTTQRCPNKIIKIFLLEGFFHLPPVSWQTFSCEYLREFSKKFETALML
jgi:hypothetical protein